MNDGCLCEHAIAQTPGQAIVHDPRCRLAPKSTPDRADLRITLAQRTSEARRSAGFTLTEAADRSGISKGQLSDVESGASGIGILPLYRLALTYGVRIEYLIDVKPIEPAPIVEIEAWEEAERTAFLAALNEYSIPYSDIYALARVSHRGRRPRTPNGWWFIYESIRRSIA